MLRLTAVLVTVFYSVCAFGQSNPQSPSAHSRFFEQKESVLQMIKTHATHIDSSSSTNGYSFMYHASDFHQGNAKTADVTFSFDSVKGLVYTASQTGSVS